MLHVQYITLKSFFQRASPSYIFFPFLHTCMDKNQEVQQGKYSKNIKYNQMKCYPL